MGCDSCPFRIGPAPIGYKPVILSVQGNVEGRFASAPKGILWHSTRSTSPTNTEAQEFYGTVNYVRQGADGLGWHATCGPNLLAVHMLAAQWAYNAREHSDDYIAIEVAQRNIDIPISLDSVKAAAYFIKMYVLPIWPSLDLNNQVHHSQTVAGIRDGKSDIFRRQDTNIIQQWNMQFLNVLRSL
jgi:hypothetical protein